MSQIQVLPNRWMFLIITVVVLHKLLTLLMVPAIIFAIVQAPAAMERRTWLDHVSVKHSSIVDPDFLAHNGCAELEAGSDERVCAPIGVIKTVLGTYVEVPYKPLALKERASGESFWR